MRRTRLAVVSVTVLVFFGIVVATAASDHGNRVDIKDDCDATFNADPPTGPGLGPGTCVRGGSTTFAEFVAQLSAKGRADGWEFNPSKLTIESDETLSTRSKGGEFHTFTEVQQFGGGCIPFINGLLHLTPVAECQPEVAPGVPLAFVTTGVPAGSGSTVGALAPGTHRFQCLIHPWMRTTVVVRQAD